MINKPGRLTDEEFEKIKTHPVRGDKILRNIEEMPKLAIGASLGIMNALTEEGTLTDFREKRFLKKQGSLLLQMPMMQ